MRRRRTSTRIVAAGTDWSPNFTTWLRIAFRPLNCRKNWPFIRARDKNILFAESPCMSFAFNIQKSSSTSSSNWERELRDWDIILIILRIREQRAINRVAPLYTCTNASVCHTRMIQLIWRVSFSRIFFVFRAHTHVRPDTSKRLRQIRNCHGENCTVTWHVRRY